MCLQNTIQSLEVLASKSVYVFFYSRDVREIVS